MFDSLDKICPNQALDIIREGNVLRDYYISEKFDLSQEGTIKYPIVINNCFFENFNCVSVEVDSEFQLKNSFLRRATFSYTYFKKGSLIKDCIFSNYLDFQSGGHNHSHFVIEGTTFNDFVNFFDCWFMSEVIIRNNTFNKGSNLFGNKGEQYEVKFDVNPIISNNLGILELDGEGI